MAPPRTAKVLLIDDEPALLRVVARIVGRKHVVVEAKTAAGARAAVEKHAASIDLVVCDVLMADTNGLALRELLVAIEPSLHDRFTFVSGGGLTSEFRRRVHATGSPILEKPVEPEELLQHIADRVRSSRET